MSYKRTACFRDVLATNFVYFLTSSVSRDILCRREDGEKIKVKEDMVRGQKMSKAHVLENL